jgi:hypothetical protein
MGGDGEAPLANPSSSEPEAQPGLQQPGHISSPPVADEAVEPDMGGPVLPEASPEAIAEAEGGGLGARMRARYQAIAATEEFEVPGWQLADGSPGLILVAKTFGDRRSYNQGVAHEVFIARSTYKLLYVNDDGSREEIPGGWGPELAKMIGTDVTKAADLIRMVISKPSPDDPSVRIPNVAGIATLAVELVEWAGKSQRQAEEDLGE